MNTGLKLATSIIQNAQGVNAWLNPSNILLVNNQFAVSSGPTNVLTIGNFLLNIPQDNAISNFTVRIKGYRGTFNTTLQIYAIDDTTGVELAYPMAPFQSFTGTNTSFTLPATTFGTTWTVDQANNIKLRLIADGELYLDAVEIECSYLPLNPTPVVPTTLGQLVVDEFVQGQRFQLAQSMTSSDLFAFVQSFNFPDGSPILITDFYGDAMIVIDQGKEGLEENAEITNIEHNFNGTGLVRLSFDTITNRGLKFKTPYDHDINLCRDHAGTAEVVISNSAPFYNRFLKKNQADVLFSVPIEVKENGSVVTPHVHGFNFVGSGVVITPDPIDGDKVIVTIAGTGNSTPLVANETTATSGTTPVASLTWQHESSGIDRMLRVIVSHDSAAAITSVEYDGSGLTLVQSVTTGDIELAEYVLIAPPVGTYDIVVTFDIPSVITGIAETWVSTDQTAPIGAVDTATGNNNNPVTPLSTTLSNSTVVDAISTAVTPIVYSTPLPQQVVNATITANTTARQLGSSYQKTGVAPDFVSMEWNLTQSTDWAHLVSEIKGIVTTIADQFVKARATDTTASYLDDKIELTPASGNVTITKTILNSGGNEKIRYAIDSSGGGGGGAANLLINQTPDNGTYDLLVGDVDGVNTVFNVSAGVYMTGTLAVYLNGLILEQGATEDWFETDPGTGEFEFVTAPAPGDIVTAIFQSTSGGFGAQSGIQFQDEGSNLGSAGTVNELDFVGTGVTASRTGGKVTVNVNSGGGTGGGLAVGGAGLAVAKIVQLGSGVEGQAPTQGGVCYLGDRIGVPFSIPTTTTSQQGNRYFRVLQLFNGTYNLEFELDVKTELTNPPGSSQNNSIQTNWMTDGTYWYAVVNYTTGSTNYLNVVRYDADGTNPVTTNIAVGSKIYGWRGTISSAQPYGAGTDGTNIYILWRTSNTAPYGNFMEEYDIATLTLQNTYTITDAQVNAVLLNSQIIINYDSFNNLFYFSGLNRSSSQGSFILSKIEISGTTLISGGTQSYPSTGWDNTDDNYENNYTPQIVSVIAYSTYHNLGIIQRNINTVYQGATNRPTNSYILKAYNVPKF